MATCKECFHFEVCDSGRHIGEYEIDDGVYTEGVENECLTFKNKTDFVEAKHGEWKHTVEFGQVGKYHYWNCSLCGVASQDEGSEHYCPQCGAKMDAERNDEDVNR